MPTASAIPHYLRDVDNPLVLPADTKIRFVITADDVIHAWWVPALGWKQDAIPGMINEAWTEIEQARHLPRPVRRAVRQGPRLHADRGEGRAQGRIPTWLAAAEAQRQPGAGRSTPAAAGAGRADAAPAEADAAAAEQCRCG